MHADKIGMTIRDEFRRERIHPDKLSLQLRSLAFGAGIARIHGGKMSAEVRDLLDQMQFAGTGSDLLPHSRHRMQRVERIDDNDGGSLYFVDSRFAEIYMSALAALLSKEADLAALTDEEGQWG